MIITHALYALQFMTVKIVIMKEITFPLLDGSLEHFKHGFAQVDSLEQDQFKMLHK
jgi:hypothetical protein